MSMSCLRLHSERIRAILQLRGERFGALAHAVGVSEPHLYGIVGGRRRASPRVISGLQRYFGEAFAFVCGDSDTLTLPGGIPHA